MLPERLAVALALLSTITLVYLGELHHWDMLTVLVAVLMGILVAMIVGRIFGRISAKELSRRLPEMMHDVEHENKGGKKPTTRTPTGSAS